MTKQIPAGNVFLEKRRGLAASLGFNRQSGCRRPPCPPWPRTADKASVYLQRDLHFDGGVEGEAVDGDRGAGVFPSFTENRQEKF